MKEKMNMDSQKRTQTEINLTQKASMTYGKNGLRKIQT